MAAVPDAVFQWSLLEKLCSGDSFSSHYGLIDADTYAYVYLLILQIIAVS